MVNGNSNIGKEIANKLKLQIQYDCIKQKIMLNSYENEKRSYNIKNLDDKDIKKYLKSDELARIKAFCKTDKFLIYDRYKINNTLYTSRIYIECKTNSYTVQIESKNQSDFKFFYMFFLHKDSFYLQSHKYGRI